MHSEKIGQQRVYNWNDIRSDIVNEAPNPQDFGNGNPYSNEEIEHDLVKVQKIKSSPEYEKSEELGDSEIQEYATAQEIGEMDWFGEDFRTDELFPNNQGTQTCVFMTSEFDDYVNHIDAVAVMNNALSNFRPVPFALDLTYNADDEGLNKKFHWQHPSKYVASPGFCTVKYFEDTFSMKPMLPKGRIEVMPRFIIGFSPDLSKQITEQRMTNTGGFGALTREEPSTKAKFCVLKELKTQSEQMLKWLENHRKDSHELRQMHTDVTALNQYFSEALKTAREHDPHRFEAYSEHDEVAQKLMQKNIISGKTE